MSVQPLLPPGSSRHRLMLLGSRHWRASGGGSRRLLAASFWRGPHPFLVKVMVRSMRLWITPIQSPASNVVERPLLDRRTCPAARQA